MDWPGVWTLRIEGPDSLPPPIVTGRFDHGPPHRDGRRLHDQSGLLAQSDSHRGRASSEIRDVIGKKYTASGVAD